MISRAAVLAAFAATLSLSAAAPQLAQSRSVSGRVIDSRTGQPVEGVTVFARQISNVTHASTVSDAQGRFTLEPLPDALFEVGAESRQPIRFGKFTVVPSADGAFVGPVGSGRYGQKTFDSAPALLRVRPGQKIADIIVPFFRDAVISGRVTDELGNPLAQAGLEFFTRGALSGWRTLVQDSLGGSDGFGTSTDDLGTFRVQHPPGDVFIRVSTTERRAVAIAGRPGQSQIRAFPRTYVGGGTSVADARPITLEPGSERQIDIQLMSLVAVSVSGVVSNEHGPVNGAYVFLESESHWTYTDASGRFTFYGVLSGEHTLVAMADWNEYDQRRIGRVRVVTDQESVSGIRVSIRPLPLVTGRVVFDGGEPVAGSDNGVITWFPADLPISFSDFADTSVLESRPAQPGFSLRVRPGRQMLQLRQPPEGWAVRSISVNGRDITGIPIEVSQDIDDVIVTLTNRVAELRGRVIVPPDVPVHAFSVCVFPNDARRWSDFGAYPERVLRIWIIDDVAGTFSVPGLPAGQYVAVVFRGENKQCRMFDWTWFRAAAAVGTHFSLAEGEQRTLDLRPATMPLPAASAWKVDEPPSIQTPLAEIRRDAQTTSIGLGAIRGTVRESDRGAPVPGVGLTLTEISNPRDPEDVWHVSGLTAEDGRFSLTGIAAGRYAIRAWRTGYIDFQYPAGDKSQPIVITAASPAVTMDISLVRTAVVTGLVTDSRSRPLANCSIVIRKANEPATTEFIARGSTDDRGAYRIWDLPPGAYALTACDRDRIEFELRAGESRMINVTLPARSPLGY